MLLQQPTSGKIRNAVFQGFTVDANHIDASACEFYGISNSTFFDVSCGDAQPGADHELEFGNAKAPVLGQDSNLTLYNIKAFDGVGAGKGALLTPQWNKGALVGVVVGNKGTKAYTSNYSRARIIGPGLMTCASVPVLTPTIANTTQYNFSVYLLSSMVISLAPPFKTQVTAETPQICTSCSRMVSR